ncbi:MAG TPA: hypothetical protein PK147_06750, partial [Saprospiraceae bacterium]|nr:hypothetical protein [Saprospiraceae bacterium]
ATVAVTVTVNTSPTVTISSSPSGTLCAGEISTLTAFPSGGSGSFAYIWNDGTTDDFITVSIPGDYSITISDDNGCIASDELTIDYFEEIDFEFDTESLFLCLTEDYDPFIPEYIVTINVTQGSGNFQYVWDVPSGLYGDAYDNQFYVDNEFSVPMSDIPYQLCCSVIDIYGCSKTNCTEVYVLEKPLVFLELGTINCDNSSVNLVGSAIALYTPSPYFEELNLYDCEGNLIDSGFGESYNFSSISFEENTCFYLEAIDENGCAGVSEELNFNPENYCGCPDIEEPIGMGEAFCSGDAIPTLTASVGGTLEINWYSACGGTLLQANSATFTPTSAGTYVIQAYDSMTDCYSDCVEVELLEYQNPVFDISGSLSFCVGSSTTLEVPNNANWTYSWMHSTSGSLGNMSTATVTTPGTVTCTVTNQFGCSTVKSVDVSSDTNLNITLNELILCDNMPDTLRAGAGFAMYAWTVPSGIPDPGSVSKIEVTTSGTYSVTVADVTGCSGSDSVEVINNTSPMASVTDTVEVCRVNNGIAPGVVVNFNDQVLGGSDAGDWVNINSVGVDLADLNSVSFEGIALGYYKFAYTTNTAQAPCENVSDTMVVRVKTCPCPTFNINPIPDLCNDGNSINLNSYLTASNGVTGTWSEQSGNPDTGVITGNTFDPDGATAGDYSVIWTINNPQGACPTMDTTSISVFQAPVVGLTQSSIDLCNEDNNLGDFEIDLNDYLTGTSDVGTWSQMSGPTPGGTLPIVNTLTLPINSQLIFRYMTNTAVDPCEDVNIDFTVNVIDCNCPQIALVMDTLCNGDMMFDLNTLIASNPSNQVGTWSSPDPTLNAAISGNNLNPFGILSGPYTVSFTLSNDPGGSCTKVFSTQIIIRRQPKAQVKGPGYACNVSGTGAGTTVVNLFSLLQSGYTNTGTWSQESGPTSVTIAMNADVDFDGTMIGDIYTFKYSLTANSPCLPVEVVVTVEIIDCNCLNVDLMWPDTLCNEGITTLDLSTLLTADTDPGTWSVLDPSGNMMTLNGNLLDVNMGTAGDYELTYTLNPSGPVLCQNDSTVLLHVSNQNVGMLTKTQIKTCNNTNDGNENIVNFVELVVFTPPFSANGTWENTDNAPVDFANPGLVTFDAANGVNLGDSYTFTYIVTSDSPCEDRRYEVEVLVDCSNCKINPSQPADICTSEGTVDLNQYNGDYVGVWSSTELTINNNVIDLSGVVAGNYNVTYTYTEAGIDPCIENFVISIFNPANAGSNGKIDVCQGDTGTNVIDLAAQLTDEDAGGTWTETSTTPSTGGAFVASAGTFNTVNQAPGVYTFTYAFTNQAPCPDVSANV